MEPCDPRIYLAAERTFLAWIRTGLALMGFGFILARFGIFLREEAGSENIPEQLGLSLPSGILLIVLGVIVNVCAALRHRRHVGALDRGEFRQSFGSTFAAAIAFLLSLVGLGMAVFLLGIR